MLLKNCTLHQNGEEVKRDIVIEGDKIVKIAENIEAESNQEVIDVAGKYVAPGFIDVHVHWREPGFSHKESIYCASRAAARGGFTTCMPMPNLNPVPDSKETLQMQLDIINRDSIIRAIPYGAITKGERGANLSDMADIVNDVFAFSDDGVGVQDANVMYEAMREAGRLGKAVVAHCEENSLIRCGCMHEGKRSKELNLPGIPSICESVQIARDILLAEAANCHYHVCHVSTKESVRLVREAKKNGIKVTCEVTPHHLLSADRDIPCDDGMWKMNPPLRDVTDRESLIIGLLDGTIDMIATDHAPHTLEEKSRGFVKSNFGIVGSETAFAQLYTHFVKTKIITLDFLVKCMSEKVADTFALPYGRLEEGAFADLTVIDLEKEMTIDTADFLSKGKNTPYVGEKIYGIPVFTLCAGKVAYKDKDF